MRTLKESAIITTRRIFKDDTFIKSPPAKIFTEYSYEKVVCFSPPFKTTLFDMKN
jgi:hypothetical protein